MSTPLVVVLIVVVLLLLAVLLTLARKRSERRTGQARVEARARSAHARELHADAERTEAARSTVLRAERVTVDGRPLTTYVVETRIDISGAESGSRLQRWWWSPELALPVRIDERISARRSGGEYTSDVSISVVDLP